MFFFVFIQDHSTGEIVFYLKGADIVMSAIVQYNDWLEEECGNMAREGLRTLVVAKKTLSEEHYQDFEVNLSERTNSFAESFRITSANIIFIINCNRNIPFSPQPAPS